METPLSDHSVVVNQQGRAIAADGTTPLRERLLAAVEQGHGSILLDVGQVSYMDSLLLGELVQAYCSAVKRGATLELINATKRLRELLRITKLDRILKTAGPEPE
jgi:anti-sigma B factor antagonist